MLRSRRRRIPLAVLVLAVLAATGAAHPRARKLKRKSGGLEVLRFDTRFRERSFRALATAPGGSAWALDGRGGMMVRLPDTGSWMRLSPGESGAPVGNYSTLVRWVDGVVLGSRFSGAVLHAAGTWRPLTVPDGPAPRRIRALEVHRDELWMAADAGLHVYRPGTLRHRSVSMPAGVQGRPTALASDGARLALATDRGELAIRDGGKWRTLPTEAPAGSRRAGAVALAGKKAWVGGAGWLREVNLAEGSPRDLLAEDRRLGKVVVTDILPGKDQVWVASLGQGLLRRKGDTWEQHLPPYVDLGSDQVHALAALEGERLMAATSRGLTTAKVTRRGVEPDDVAAWIPKTDIPKQTDLSRTDPEPRQIFDVVQRGGKLSPLAALGDMLFEDPSIMGERAKRMGISCGTCHPRGHMNTNLFIDGISIRRGGADLTSRHFSAKADNGVLDPSDTPSLRGVRFTAPYGRTQQAPDIRTFTRNVIVLEFEGPEPDDRTLDALTLYQREFNFLPARWIGEDGRLSEDAPAKVKRGEEVFTREFPSLPGGSCAACHPRHSYFTDGRMHDIGTGGGFDVPTLRNANYSPPYMHDGRFATYREVIDHFDETYRLRLNKREKADLEAYLMAVGEGLQPYE